MLYFTRRVLAEKEINFSSCKKPIFPHATKPTRFGVFLKFLQEALNPQNYCLLTDSLGLSFQIWIFFQLRTKFTFFSFLIIPHFCFPVCQYTSLLSKLWWQTVTVFAVCFLHLPVNYKAARRSMRGEAKSITPF